MGAYDRPKLNQEGITSLTLQEETRLKCLQKNVPTETGLAKLEKQVSSTRPLKKTWYQCLSHQSIEDKTKGPKQMFLMKPV